MAKNTMLWLVSLVDQGGLVFEQEDVNRVNTVESTAGSPIGFTNHGATPSIIVETRRCKPLYTERQKLRWCQGWCFGILA